jgi:hypothetical protein
VVVSAQLSGRRSHLRPSLHLIGVTVAERTHTGCWIGQGNRYRASSDTSNAGPIRVRSWWKENRGTSLRSRRGNGGTRGYSPPERAPTQPVRLSRSRQLLQLETLQGANKSTVQFATSRTSSSSQPQVCRPRPLESVHHISTSIKGCLQKDVLRVLDPSSARVLVHHPSPSSSAIVPSESSRAVFSLPTQ